MTTKNLEFYYRKDKADRKQTCLILPVEYTQEAKIYPDSCRLKADFIEVCTERSAYQIAATAQRLILFTDALGLHYQRTGNPQRMGCNGMDHQEHFTGGKKERVVLDSPYHRYELDSTVWRSVWLPRSSDPYYPGVTFGRLSIFYRSTANIEQLAERVSHLNFDLFSRDSTVEEGSR